MSQRENLIANKIHVGFLNVSVIHNLLWPMDLILSLFCCLFRLLSLRRWGVCSGCRIWCLRCGRLLLLPAICSWGTAFGCSFAVVASHPSSVWSVGSRRVCVWWCKVITFSARLCADFCPNAEMRQIGFNVPDPLFLLVYMLLFCVVMTTFLWCFWLDSTSSMNIFITQ